MSSKQLKKKNSKNSDEKIKIKTEKLDNKIYTMEHYVGDPVELIKQVFTTLNPKTIKNLAPESLKECKIEEIQELCFNELLGISSKRLISVINATKCPTDTESSDDDIQNIDEHISLEEISSDSDNGKKSDKNKNGKVNPEAKTKGTNNKEMSVLELLELQARARAIRSQLALEPIAKIEVDSDDSNDESEERISKSKKTTVHHNENHNKNSHNKSSGQSSSVSVKIGEKRKEENNVIVNGTGNNSTTTNENRPKKIKLKRNFRKRSIDQNTENTTNNSNQLNIVTDKKELPSSEQNIEKINEKSPKIDTERSPSPEVLQIMPNYETLCISDSDDDDDTKEKQKNTTKSTENHKNGLDKSDKTSNDNNENGISKEIREDDMREDFEDGEIIDNNVKVVINSNDKDNDSTKNNDNNDNENNDKSENENDDNNDHKSETENAINSSEENTLDTNKIVEITNEIDLNDSDHHNDDDIISLGDDDDLDYEMHDPADDIKEKSQIIPKIERKSPEKNDDINEPTDFIELHDSGDETESTVNQGQSWNTRWLQSKKVSKIMAESKLGNRVRDKRKKTKKAQLEHQQQKQQQQQQDLELAKEKLDSNSKNNYKSNFEDGSLQQYKEIIDRVMNTE